MKSAHAPASASEASTYRRCPRLWAFKYRWDAGPKVSRQAYFAVGSKFDKIVEDYWKLGIIPSDPNDSLTQLFMATLPIIPGPGQHRALQLKDNWQYKDLQILTVSDYLGEDMIGDLKTTKDIKAYGLLTKEQKLDDMQTVMYSYRYLPWGGTFDHWYAQKHRAVELQYEDKILDPALAYKLGKKVSTAPVQPKASGSPIHLTRPEIEDAFARVCEPACTAVVQLRRKHARIDPLTLPKPDLTENPKDSPCEAYGGCEYKKTCFPRGDLSRANLTSTYAEVSMRPSTQEVSVKFKIQKPAEQIEAPQAREPVAEAPKKFSPFKKAVQTEIPTEPENKVDVLVLPDMTPAVATVEEDNVVVATTPTEDEVVQVPELASPATVELEVDEPTIPVESLVKGEAQIENLADAALDMVNAALDADPVMRAQQEQAFKDIELGRSVRLIIEELARALKTR